jgi:hypothetical protein
VKLVVLAAVPSGVVMLIVPVSAPVGTVAVTSVLDFTLNSVAATPPKVTAVVWLRLTPVMVTLVPTGPLAGVKLVICGVTRKGTLLVSVPVGVTTVRLPVLAPAGTMAVISVLETTVNVAARPSKMTLVAPVRAKAVEPTVVGHPNTKALLRIRMHRNECQQH